MGDLSKGAFALELQLLHALRDLMMLPFQMLADKSIRKEVIEFNNGNKIKHKLDKRNHDSSRGYSTEITTGVVQGLVLTLIQLSEFT